MPWQFLLQHSSDHCLGLEIGIGNEIKIRPLLMHIKFGAEREQEITCLLCDIRCN